MKKRVISLVWAAWLMVVFGGVTGCPDPKRVEAAVFTVEQVVCMTAVLSEGLLDGEAATIADDVRQACAVAPALTKDIIDFIHVFAAKRAQFRKDGIPGHPAPKR